MATATKETGGSKSRAAMPRVRKPLTKGEARDRGEAGRFARHLEALLADRGLDHKGLVAACVASGFKVEDHVVRAWLRGENMPKTLHLRKLGKALKLADYRLVLPE